MMRKFKLFYTDDDAMDRQVELFHAGPDMIPQYREYKRERDPRYHSTHPAQPKFEEIDSAEGTAALMKAVDLLATIIAE